MRLLLVDDDPGRGSCSGRHSRSSIFELDEADSAAMAARRISARKPDVIVLDVLMPGIDGIEYCAKLKGDPQTNDIPVVLLTGSERPIQRVARRRARAQAVQPARAPRGRRASRRRHERRAATSCASCRVGGAAPSLCERPSSPRRGRTPTAGAPQCRVSRHRRRAGGRARVEGHGHARALRACAALRRRARRRVAPELLKDPSIEYGFVLHDVGKIGVRTRSGRSRPPLAHRAAADPRRTRSSARRCSRACRSWTANASSSSGRTTSAGRPRLPDRLGGDDPLGARVFASPTRSTP